MTIDKGYEHFPSPGMPDFGELSRTGEGTVGAERGDALTSANGFPTLTPTPALPRHAGGGRIGECRLLLLGFSLATSLIGCTTPPPATQPTSMYDRSEKAIQDPFHYSPDMKKYDISGGGLSDFDREGFQRDLKNVLDP